MSGQTPAFQPNDVRTVVKAPRRWHVGAKPVCKSDSANFEKRKVCGGKEAANYSACAQPSNPKKETQLAVQKKNQLRLYCI